MSWLKSLFNRPEPYWKSVEPYWETVNIYDGGPTFLTTFATVPEVSRHLLATHWCQSEVRNGGFEQFYINNTGVLAPEAAAGFRALGMVRSAEIIEEQLAAFGPDYPRDKKARADFLAAMDEAFFDTRSEDAEPTTEEAGPLLVPRNEEFWRLNKTEAGGFIAAANRYAETSGA